MALVCKKCGKEYDVTLFQFGRKVKCGCGNIVGLEIKNLNKEISKTGRFPFEKEDELRLRAKKLKEKFSEVYKKNESG